VEETFSQGFALERQVMQVTSSGLELPLAVSTSLLRDERGNVSGIIIILRDMTATKELERMRKLDQMKSQFVANVSHELRTPLTSIRAYTEALKDMAGDEMQRSFLEVIESESDRLLYLIEDLLNLSRIESGRLQLNLEMTAPSLIVEEIMGLSKLHSDKHRLMMEIEPDLPEMLMDKEKMKEVVINLVSNAIKYSPDGGEVRIKLYLDEGNLRLDVIDQGIGIPKEMRKKIFEQFFRVDSSMTAEIGGTGLGLAIVKSIVEAHGGVIKVESEVGKGSTFSVLLPVRQEKKRRTAATGAPPDSQAPSSASSP
jgi:signal transduction histidine kinase